MTDEFKQLQKKEALKRLEILKSNYDLPEYVVKDFADNDIKYYSEHVIYKDEWKIKKIGQDDYFENAVKEFEKKIIHSYIMHFLQPQELMESS